MSRRKNDDDVSNSDIDESSSGGSDSDEGLSMVRRSMGKKNRSMSALACELSKPVIEEQSLNTSTELTKRYLNCEELSQAQQGLSHSLTRNLLYNGGALSTDILKMLAHDSNRLHENDNRVILARSGGSLVTKEHTQVLSELSKEGYTFCIANNSLPKNAKSANKLKKIESDECKYYIACPDAETKPDCFICKLIFEVSMQDKKKGPPKKVVTISEGQNPIDYLIGNSSSSKDPALDTQYVVYQVTHVYCAASEKTFPNYTMPPREKCGDFTPLWVLGSKNNIVQIHFVLAPMSVQKSADEELKLLKRLSEPCQSHDAHMILSLIDCVSQKTTCSNHPGMLAHYSLEETGHLYKMTTIQAVLTMSKPSMDNARITKMLMNTFREKEESKRLSYIKKFVFKITGFVCKKGRKIGRVSSTDVVSMDCYIDMNKVFSTTTDNVMDLNSFLNHLKNDLRESEDFSSDHFPSSQSFKTGIVGFKCASSKVCPQYSSSYCIAYDALNQVCTNKYSYENMENPDDEEKAQRLIAMGTGGSKELDLMVSAGVTGVGKVIQELNAKFQVKNVTVNFCNFEPQKSMNLLGELSSFVDGADKYQRCNCIDAKNKKLELQKFIIRLTVTILLSSAEICLGTILDNVVTAIGDDFEFSVNVEDTENIYKKEFTGKNAIYELMAAVIGITAWTVSQLLASDPEDIVRVSKHKSSYTQEEYVHNVVCEESGDFNCTLASYRRAFTSFNPGVVIYYLDSINFPHKPRNLTTKIEGATECLKRIKQQCKYACKKAASSDKECTLPEVYLKFEYNSFDALVFTPVENVTLSQFLECKNCKALEGGDGDINHDSEDSDRDDGPAKKKSKRGKPDEDSAVAGGEGSTRGGM
jgi:hypothetical protein